jgi:four helix bundle protein
MANGQWPMANTVSVSRCSSCDAVRPVTVQFFPPSSLPIVRSGLNSKGLRIAPAEGMHEPSPKRQQILALHARAIQFSTNVNECCPKYFSNVPSKTVWENLVRAADSTSNNLVEADDASSNADFLAKMGIALREAKESRVGLMKLRIGRLDACQQTANLQLESEAKQLSAIFATIIRNTRARIEREKPPKKRQTRRR